MAPRLGIALTAAGILTVLAACGARGLRPRQPGPPRPRPRPPPPRAPRPRARAVPRPRSPPRAILRGHPGYHRLRDLPVAAGHLLIRVPEGWSRKTTPASSTFTSNLNSISVGWMPMAAAPTVSSVRATTVHTLQASTLAFRLQSIRAVKLAGGPAVEIVYQVNSPPNGVTGRQYRLVIERFELYRHGRGAVIALSSAVGSDNVDPWRIVSESFRWK